MDGRMRAGVSRYAQQQQGLRHNEAKCTLQCGAPFSELTVHIMHWVQCTTHFLLSTLQQEFIRLGTLLSVCGVPKVVQGRVVGGLVHPDCAHPRVQFGAQGGAWFGAQPGVQFGAQCTLWCMVLVHHCILLIRHLGCHIHWRRPPSH